MVILDKIQDINRPERRGFISSEEMNYNNNNRVRTGAPTSFAKHDMGLSTIIGRSDKDAGGHKIDTATRYKMDRLRTWDFRIQNSQNIMSYDLLRILANLFF